MKKLFVLLLAMLLVLGMAACATPNNNSANNPTTEPPQVTDPTDPTDPTEPTVGPLVMETPELKNNVYQLTKPGHLLFMAENPDREYALAADIDLEGREWTPVDTFSGKFVGRISEVYNFTISNFTIRATSADADVGFFRVATGTIKEVNFENVTIVCDGTFSGNMGVVVGRAEAQLNEIDVKNSVISVAAKDANIGMVCGKNIQGINHGTSTGTLQVTLAGGTCNVGGISGLVENTVQNLESRADIQVTGTNAAGAVGGVIGKLSGAAKTVTYVGNFKVNTDATVAAGNLAGEIACDGLMAGFNCAVTTQITGATTQDAYVGKQAADTVLNDCWTRDVSGFSMSADELARRELVVDYMYRTCTYRWTPAVDFHYTDTCNTSSKHEQTFKAGTIYFGPLYSHLCMSLEAMEAVLDENGVLRSDIPGELWDEYFGNDCADAMYWAYSQISSKVTYTLTKNSICTNGFLPVGGYTVINTTATADICTGNGAQVMYEAYAAAKLGDAVLNGPGHIRMVAENAYVFRNADGSINPDKSYIVTHQQGSGFGATQVKNQSTCKTFAKYTFTQLFNTNYIPMTIEAFTAGPDEATVSTTNTATDKTGLGVGVVSSNYRLNWVTVKLTDASGAAVYNKTIFVTNNNESNTDRYDLSAFKAELDALALTAGSKYTYTVEVGVRSQATQVQSFTFTA